MRKPRVFVSVTATQQLRSDQLTHCRFCGRAIDRVWYVMAGKNNCVFCQQPIVMNLMAFQAAQVLARIGGRASVEELILREDAATAERSGQEGK